MFQVLMSRTQPRVRRTGHACSRYLQSRTPRHAGSSGKSMSLLGLMHPRTQGHLAVAAVARAARSCIPAHAGMLAGQPFPHALRAPTDKPPPPPPTCTVPRGFAPGTPSSALCVCTWQ